ncbi:MAG: zinc ribbon domain-containing protein [Coxiellaceae bacterium]|nr:zinc ribbon domain-containing protein [Coxiellaceae bacterium]
MPIYEYQCQQCGHHCELLQKISDNPATTCPECHKESLKKLVSAAGFQLKGTGWYVTDFRDKGKAKPKTDSSAAAVDSKSTDSKKSDDKKSSSTSTDS